MSTNQCKIVSTLTEAEPQHFEWEIRNFNRFMSKKGVRIVQNFDFVTLPFKLSLIKQGDAILLELKSIGEWPEMDCYCKLMVDAKLSNQTHAWSQMEFDLNCMEFDEETKTWTMSDSLGVLNEDVVKSDVSLQLRFTFESLIQESYFNVEDYIIPKHRTTEESYVNGFVEDPAVPFHDIPEESINEQLSEDDLNVVYDMLKEPGNDLNVIYDMLIREHATLMEQQKFFEAIQVREKVHHALKAINDAKRIGENNII